jgi:hypothetical protein
MLAPAGMVSYRQAKRGAPGDPGAVRHCNARWRGVTRRERAFAATVNPARHEAVVQALPEQRLATLQSIMLPVSHSPGLLPWKEYTYDVCMRHYWWHYPYQIGSRGFYVASMRA